MSRAPVRPQGMATCKFPAKAGDTGETGDGAGVLSSSACAVRAVPLDGFGVGRIGAHIDAALPLALQGIDDGERHAADRPDLDLDPLAILQGAEKRVRPIMMTAFTAIFGLLPAALSTDIGAQTQRPLAIVVVGGMITTLFLTRYLMPVLYSFYGHREPPQTAGVGH